MPEIQNVYMLLHEKDNVPVMYYIFTTLEAAQITAERCIPTGSAKSWEQATEIRWMKKIETRACENWHVVKRVLNVEPIGY